MPVPPEAPRSEYSEAPVVVPDAGASEGMPPAEVPQPNMVAEKWAGMIEAASKIGPRVMLEADRRYAVAAAQNPAHPETTPDGTIMRPVTSAAWTAFAAIAPSTVAVRLSRRPRTIDPRTWLPDQVHEHPAAFGWTVYQTEYLASKAAKQPGDETALQSADDLLAEPVEYNEAALQEADPDVIIDRIVVMNGSKGPLWRIVGPRDAIERSGVELSRIPILAKEAIDDGKLQALLDAYAQRNNFVPRAEVRVEVLTPEGISGGDITFENSPLEMADLVVGGLRQLFAAATESTQQDTPKT
ncbi:MAG: hypothetical protein AAB834_05245 [Patescibacteria group bacterium]